MLRSLREDVLPRFDPLDGEAHSDIPSDRRGRGLPDTRELPLFPPADRRRSERRTERLDLRDLVGEWAKRWHLTDEWCVRAARLQLRLWADPQLAAWLHEGEGSTDSWSPFRLWQTHRDIAEDGFTWAMPGEEDRSSITWGRSAGLGEEQPAPDSPRPRLGIPPLNLEIESESDWLRGARTMLDQHAKEERERLKASGLELVAQRRGGSEHEHFKWLAYSQVQKWSQKDIAKRYRVRRTSIGQVLHRAAKSINLSRRSWSPGRPPGKKKQLVQK